MSGKKDCGRGIVPLMAIFFDGISALECYRGIGSAAAKLGSAKRYAREFEGSSPHAEELARIAEGFPQSGPVRLVVASPSKRCRVRNVSCRVFASPVPKAAFVRLTEGAYACSPAFAFVRSALEVELVDLVKLGFEITGSYRLASTSEQGFLSASPLATCRQLDAFSSQSRLPGARKAANALKFVIPGSASPMETALSMVLTMPNAKGGYGLPSPQLNAAVDVPRADWRVAFGRQFRCDLLWLEAGFAVEYDSDMFHASSAKIAQDAKRRNALSSLGITVLTVTRAQFSSIHGLDQVASQVARGIGTRVRMERVNRAAQRKLLACVLG